MFRSSKQFRRNPKLFIYDKPLPTGSYRESAANPVLDCFDSPNGSGVHTKLFDMSKGKNFVVEAPAGFTTHYQSVNEIIDHLSELVQFDTEKQILNVLHQMYLSSVRSREYLPDGMLDDITDLFQSIKLFYEQVFEANSRGGNPLDIPDY